MNGRKDYLSRVLMLMADYYGATLGNSLHALAVSFVAAHPYVKGQWHAGNPLLDAIESHVNRS